MVALDSEVPIAEVDYARATPAGETLLFRVAAALIVLHILDDTVVQPEPGTSAADHLSTALVPTTIAVAAAVAYPALRPGLGAGIAAMFGIFALLNGFISVGGLRAEGSASDWSGLLLVPTGAVLVGLGIWVPWRERGRWAPTRRRRWLHRAIAVVVGGLLAIFFVVPVSAAMWTTQKFRSATGTFSAPHEDVSFRTSDGLVLAGWYVPSRNRAAVVLVQGGGGSRDGARRHAALLARAGYGVLLYDARGRVESEGDTDAFGWTWGRDVDAGIAWLKRRPDVDPEKIGALGLSTGADVLVQVAAHRTDLRAVVADGSTNRSLADVANVARGGDWLAMPFYATLYGAAEVFLDARPGPPLEDLAADVPPTPIMFVGSNWAVERQAAPVYAEAARASSRLWEVDAGHTQGLKEHPREYARRVLTFFDRNLLHDK